MAPSRGSVAAHSPHLGHADHADDHAAINQQSNTALQSARRNFKYFLNPTTAGTKEVPRLRTRALLRAFRYISQFVLWRLVRWAKYAAVGALVAGISATAIGSVVTGAAWVVAPTGIAGGIMASVIWGTGKFAARRLHRRWKKTGGDVGIVAREKLEDEGSAVKREGRYGLDVGPDATAW